MYGYDPAMLSSASISNPNVNDQNAWVDDNWVSGTYFTNDVSIACQSTLTME